MFLILSKVKAAATALERASGDDESHQPTLLSS